MSVHFPVVIQSPSSHQLLPVQTVDTGGAIVGCHDGGNYLLRLGYRPRSWIWYLDILLPDYRVSLLVNAVLVMDSLLLALVFERSALETDAEGVFLVGELVNEIACLAPKRKVVVGIGSVKGRVRAVLVVVQQTSGIGVRAPGR
jgi:hypothetical protein